MFQYKLLKICKVDESLFDLRKMICIIFLF